jgi:hypothetical protein
MLRTMALAAVAFVAVVGSGGKAVQAAPFSPAASVASQGDIVQVQYRDRGRQYGPPRRVCRWEIVEHRVRGRIIKERVQRCRVVRL